MEKPFDDEPGVLATTSGFTGGLVVNPSYDLVVSGVTGHTEAVQVTYDPTKVSYARLLDIFWLQVDPYDPDGQFCDQGSTYRPGIFPANEAERTIAEASKAQIAATLPAPVVVQIEAYRNFYPAEDYHQDFYKKNPVRYNFYRNGCGRDSRLKQVWGDRAK
jgi:peptide-methionine (S)-S-oxide reductase